MATKEGLSESLDPLHHSQHDSAVLTRMSEKLISLNDIQNENQHAMQILSSEKDFQQDTLQPEPSQEQLQRELESQELSFDALTDLLPCKEKPTKDPSKRIVKDQRAASKKSRAATSRSKSQRPTSRPKSRSKLQEKIQVIPDNIKPQPG